MLVAFTLYDSPKDSLLPVKDGADAFPSVYFCVVFVFSTTKEMNR